MQNEQPMAPVRFTHPPVHYNERGVASVDPADILRSAAGQAQIRKFADAARAWGVNGRNGAR